MIGLPYLIIIIIIIIINNVFLVSSLCQVLHGYLEPSFLSTSTSPGLSKPPPAHTCARICLWTGTSGLFPVSKGKLSYQSSTLKTPFPIPINLSMSTPISVPFQELLQLNSNPSSGSLIPSSKQGSGWLWFFLLLLYCGLLIIPGPYSIAYILC